MLAWWWWWFDIVLLAEHQLAMVHTKVGGVYSAAFWQVLAVKSCSDSQQGVCDNFWTQLLLRHLFTLVIYGKNVTGNPKHCFLFTVQSSTSFKHFMSVVSNTRLLWISISIRIVYQLVFRCGICAKNFIVFKTTKKRDFIFWNQYVII